MTGHRTGVRSARADEPPRRRFLTLFRGLTRNRQKWQVFSDFCALSALALANGIVKDEGREAEYMGVIARYEALEDRLALKAMLDCVVEALEADFDAQRRHSRPVAPVGDFLGSLFMELELSSHWHGQFFTPYDLCHAVAHLTYSREDMQLHVAEDGFVTALEPACGAGAMVIAFAALMREYGFQPHEHMHVVAVDVDRTAAHMCFIQLALLGIPATVHVSDSLANEMGAGFHTPAHILGGWSLRLWLRRLRSSALLADGPEAAASPPVAAAAPAPGEGAFAFTLVPARQVDLFAD